MTQPGTAAARASSGYMLPLDGLRCIAVLIVIWEHAGSGPLIKGLGNHGIGVYGVWLFFVLSGFLITGILLRERDRRLAGVVTLGSALRTFYARRFLRIFPVYYLLLAIMFVIGLIPEFRADFLWYASYLANWMFAARARFPLATGHLWSLGVEEQFYMLWPLLILVVSTRVLPWFLVGTVLFSLASRTAIGLITTSSISVLTPTVSNLDSLAIGALLAWHHHSRSANTVNRSRLLRAGLVAGILMVIANTYLSFAVHRGWRIFNMTEALSASLIAAWLVNRAALPSNGLGNRLLSWGPLVYFGRISYGVYLYHYVLIFAFHRFPGMREFAHAVAPHDGVAFFLFITVVTLAVASLSWYAFEKPVNALKNRFPYGEPAARPAIPAAIAVAADSAPVTPAEEPTVSSPDRWIIRTFFAVFLLFLLEVFGQVAIRIMVGTWPLTDRGGRNAEIFERHPYLVGVPRPGAAVQWNNRWARINASGYRGPAFGEPSDTVFRVLALGGSTTFGYGVDDANTWPVRLQAMLDSALATRPGRYRRAEVINGGVPGYTSAENLIQLELLGLYLKPDLVLLFQGLNDIRTAHSPGLRSDYANFHAISQESNLALDRLKVGQRSGIIRLARLVLTRVFLEPPPHLVLTTRRGDRDTLSEDIFRSNLESFTAVCRAHGIPCVFVPQVVSPFHPMDGWWMPYLVADSLPVAMVRYNGILKSTAEATGTPYVAAVTDIAWTAGDFFDFCHFTRLGGIRFATALEPYVLEAASHVTSPVRPPARR